MWRVHRLDRIIANIPAKLLDSKSLTLNFSRKQIWPVYLCDTPGALALYFPIEATARLESFVASGALPLVAGTEFTGLIYRGVINAGYPCLVTACRVPRFPPHPKSRVRSDARRTSSARQCMRGGIVAEL